LDYLLGEKALLKVDDYKTIKFLKKVQALDDREKQKAEILILYGKYDTAETIYRNLERKDLAINMRVRVGDWFRVLEMVREGSGYDETLNKMTNQLGNYYAERLEWDRAAEFYATGKNYKGMMECFTMMEDYDSMAQLVDEVPDNDDLLSELADRFQLAGMAEHAVKCYEKLGEYKKAVDCCVLLNHWNIATEMAEKHGYMQVEGLLQQNATELLNKNKRLEAAELYRKANRNT
jgi:WD repeat-containing protein 35